MKAGELPSAPLREFLARHGFGEGATLAPLGGGGRHRVHAVARGERKAALKIYEAPSQGRDAFVRETAVHRLLAEHVPGSVPQLLGSDPTLRCVLFSWVEGRKLRVGEINPGAVRRMANFVVAINTPALRDAARGMDLPQASDAAFTIAGHLGVALARLEGLRAGSDQDPLREELDSFVAGTLLPAIDSLGGRNGHDIALRDAERVFSPSDFGFHNAIVGPAGDFCFIDFEHAGWDDPAKMAADFILQPECRLDAANAGSFIGAMEHSGVFSGSLRERVQALLPVQALKWTAIMLNVFQRPDQPRDLLRTRLDKARSYWRQASAEIPALTELP